MSELSGDKRNEINLPGSHSWSVVWASSVRGLGCFLCLVDVVPDTCGIPWDGSCSDEASNNAITSYEGNTGPQVQLRLPGCDKSSQVKSSQVKKKREEVERSRSPPVLPKYSKTGKSIPPWKRGEAKEESSLRGLWGNSGQVRGQRQAKPCGESGGCFGKVFLEWGLMIE